MNICNSLTVNGKRELLLFDWVVIDNCNLACHYCVNKGAYSHKSANNISYIPGTEIKIAEKIGELTPVADKIIVNLTGGEPLLATYIVDVFNVLTKFSNIYVNLVTNLKLLDKYAHMLIKLPNHIVIGGSLHVSYRSDVEIENLISLLNRYKNNFKFTLTQVDYDLTPADIQKISRIKSATGLDVIFQTFIPPWTEAGTNTSYDKIRDANFVASKGKRCCLGYSHFFILPDGTFYYDLWCNEHSRKIGNFLRINNESIDDFILTDMKKCLTSSCGCNYNTLNYPEYISACKRHGYPDTEIFGTHNTRLWQRILRLLRSYKVS